MLKSEVRTSTQKFPVSFFEDDTILTVRQKIASVVDIHPDRLFILVNVNYGRNYYKQDPRNWEALFERLSLNGRTIQKEIFDTYLEYRTPTLTIPFQEIDKEEWMFYPDELEDIFDPTADFSEYRIFGVEEHKSFCLPLKFSPIVTKIPSVSYPIPDNSKLFSSFYKHISGFFVQPFEKGFEGPYFPLLQSITPTKLSTSQLEKLDKDTEHLTNILALDPPPPESIHILKAVWYVQLVDSDFGVQIRNKFEQIFYGLTVTETVPCITFFTGKENVSRHKFFTNNVHTKKPFIDVPMWSSWWSKSKPPRSRATLVLYRGTTRENYDRISISSTDIVFASYRDITNTETVPQMKISLEEWFSNFDAVVPFIKSTDLSSCRWSLQEIQYEAKYKNPLEELDTRRLNCVSGIFDELRTHKTIFRFLRTDYADDGLTSTDIRILDLLKDSPLLTPADIERETGIPLSDATKLLVSIKTRIDENPSLLTKSFRGFPLYKFTASSVIATDVYDIDRSVKYMNILNYILSNPTSKELDKICPKRVETVKSTISTINVSYDTTDDFGDLFDYIDNQEIEKPEEKKTTRVSKKNTKYGYLLQRLQSFDPQTFESYAELKYPKVCEHSHQPIVLSNEEISDMASEFNPKINLSEDKILNVKEPDGTYLCPEYWCMHDKIPLKQDQLVKVDGVDACPVCKGKVRNFKDEKSDMRDFSVIKRDKKFSYPGYSKLVAKNEKSLPCCFQTSANREKKLVSDEGGKYYIMKDNTTGLPPLRFAFLSQTIIDSLHIKEDYDLINKSNGRIQTGISAFFRIGLGRPSETLPELFNVKSILPPSQGVRWLLKSTFITTWLERAEPTSEIDMQLKEIAPFNKDAIAREHINRIVASIDEYYKDKKLTIFQELEYCALMLGIDLFKIDMVDESMACTFYTRHVLEKSRGLVVLYKNDEVDCLCHVVRTQRKFEYRANIFEPPFNKDTINEIIDLREKACHTNVPSFSEALSVVQTYLPDKFKDISIILDPFGRAQSIFIADTVILPFKNTSFPEVANNSYINGYADIKDHLPDYTEMKLLLDKASKSYSGFKVDHDIYSGEEATELLLVSGLRVPIKPFKMEGRNDEVFNTVFKEGETDLVFGDKNKEDQDIYRSISYASELFEFLIFQLSKDINDYREIRVALSRLKPIKRELEPLLQEWFDKTTLFHQVDEPLQFLSKIRVPCGQLKNKNICENSHMCGWDGKCKIEIRNTFSKTKLFNKLLGSLMENPKTRYSILDSLTTPFFSTILYLELPNEVILTDFQLK